MSLLVHPAVLAFVAGTAFLSAAEIPCGSAESMDGLMAAWTEACRAAHPDAPARVVQRAKFSADLVEALGRGELAVAPFARELFPAEEARLRELAGLVPRLVPVATGSRATKGGTHAIIIFVHGKNPLARLTLRQLRAVFAGEIATWGQLGAVGEWAERPVRVHGMKVRRDGGNPPGIVNFLERRVLDGAAWRPDLREHTDSSEQGQALEQIVRAVAADECAIGYSGFAYAVEGAKALALGEREGGPFFAGTSEDIRTRRYPLTRTLYLAVSPRHAAAAENLLRTALSPEGQQAVAADRHGFFPLPLPLTTASVALPAYEPREIKLDQGAPFLTSDGRVTIVGYNDMEQMLRALTARFTALHPGVEFALRLPATRAAPAALARQESAFAPMGAEFSAQQLAEFRPATGAEPRAFRIAHASLSPAALSGPLAIVVRRDSPRTAITLPELRRIFCGEARQELRPVGLSADTALGEFMRRRVLAGGDFGALFQGFPQSRQVIQAVAKDAAAIGFAAAVSVTPEVKALAVAPDAHSAPVPLTEEQVWTARYPLDRWLLIYTTAEPSEVTQEFLRFALSREGQEIVAQGSLGYLPLNPQEATQELATLAASRGEHETKLR